MTLDLNNKKYLKWLGITLGIIFIIALILFGTSMALAYKYSNQIYPGIKIDDVNLGGLTKTQATNIIKGKFKQTYKDGFTFSYLDNTKQIENLDENILTLNLESLIDQAFTVGHNDAYWKKYLKLLAFPITKKSIPVDYRFDKELLKQNLQTEFAILEKPAQNSEIIIEINDPEEQQYTLDFSEAKQGETFNFNQAINQLDLAIQNFSNPAITLIHSVDQPQITKNDALTQSELIKELLQLEKIIFTYTDKQWEIGWEDFTHWLELDLNEQELVSISLNQDMVNGQLESIGQEINQPAIDAKLQIKAGRVAEFQASEDGLELNQEESYNKILQEIIKNKNPKIELIVEVTNPEVNVGSTNDLGIKEMIGSGWSDFSGSPSNRRHNIGIGAASLHGALIAPGEEFSLIGILGDIDGQHGYKPELVIKKGETIPEYGGGLCQVGTTIFRSVLQSGLKITARRNHSYRVGYYEPAGTDATIYDPWPDFKFINDTEHHVLIQSKIWGNNLMFEIWGTKDGRKVSFEGQTNVANVRYLKPTIFNITKPGPAKEIETTDLEPGEKKRTEHAHNGADTVFYHYITKPGQETEKITYSSHYVAWQEVFLVGVDPEAKEKEAQDIIEEQEAEALADDPEVTNDPEEEEAEETVTTEE